MLWQYNSAHIRLFYRLQNTILSIKTNLIEWVSIFKTWHAYCSLMLRHGYITRYSQPNCIMKKLSLFCTTLLLIASHTIATFATTEASPSLDPEILTNNSGIRLLLIGMVYDKVTKQPLAEASVELLDPASASKQRFVTNQDGRFYFKLIENKSYKLVLVNKNGSVEDQRMISTINKTEPEIMHAVLEGSRPALTANSEYTVRKSPTTALPTYDIASLSFKIQIGAFKEKPGAAFMKSLGNRKVVTETGGGGYVRYLTGDFNNYKDAQNLERQLKQQGYNSAFIVAYQKGERLKISAEDAIKQ